MFENTQVADLKLAVERDGNGRLCAAVQRTPDGKIVATATAGEVTYHIPTNKKVKEIIALALVGYFNRIGRPAA